MRRVIGFVVGAALAFAVITLVALEGGETVVLRTADGTGDWRATRIWIADDGDAALIEAATPDRSFLRQLRAAPAVELVRGGQTWRCASEVLPNPEGHDRIRALLRARYGWADRWIGLLTDTSQSLAVRLRCE